MNHSNYVSSGVLAADVPSSRSPVARQPSHLQAPQEIQRGTRRNGLTDSDSLSSAN